MRSVPRQPENVRRWEHLHQHGPCECGESSLQQHSCAGQSVQGNGMSLVSRYPTPAIVGARELVGDSLSVTFRLVQKGFVRPGIHQPPSLLLRLSPLLADGLCAA